jgi:hypothetical protein
MPPIPPDHEIAQATPPIQKGPYGPRVILIAHFIAPRIGRLHPFDLIESLEELWPDLTLRDLVGALVLGEALSMKTEGTA